MEINEEFLDEVKVFDGQVSLIKTTIWSPQNTNFKYKLISTDCDLNTVEEWSFDSEESAFEAMEDLRENLRV